MSRRLASLAILLVLLPAAPALGQSNPFTVPTPAAPQPQPTVVVPQPTPANTLDEGTDRGFLYAIAGGLVLIFGVLGFYITRDARKNLTKADRRSLDREKSGAPREDLTPEQRREAARAKGKARRRTKAQKRARKVQRGKR